VAAREDQPQPFIRDRVVRISGVLRRQLMHGDLLGRFFGLYQQRQLGTQRCVPPDRVYRAPLGRGGEPGIRVVRDAGADPTSPKPRRTPPARTLGQIQIPRDACGRTALDQLVRVPVAGRGVLRRRVWGVRGIAGVDQDRTLSHDGSRFKLDCLVRTSPRRMDRPKSTASRKIIDADLGSEPAWQAGPSGARYR
jgi:hypothetical protein